MMMKRILITTGAGLALCLGALAGPADEQRLSELEARAREQSERAEEKIHHLEEAARHLEAIGMADDAARLRDQAALRRTDHRKRLAELEQLIRREAEIRRQRELAGLVQEAIDQLKDEWRDGPPSGHPPVHGNDDADEGARAEAHRRQTLQTWQRIKDAARGERPLPPQAGDPAGDPDPSPPRHHDAPTKPLAETAPHAGRPIQGESESQAAVLEQILRTLQRIERKMEGK